MVSCPKCEYSGTRRGLSGHWRFYEDHRPAFSNEQKEILTGVLMGDGSIKVEPSYPKIQCNSITIEYLEYLYKTFYPLSCKPKLRATAEELAEHNRNTGFDENASAETYSDSFFWHTVTHPELKEFKEWYSSGKKVWPENIELTPVVLKHWYCGDGHYNKESGRIQLSIDNECEHKQKIENYFKRGPSVDDIYWNEYKRENKTQCIMEVRKSSASRLFEYMGGPLPGFEYKWPERFK